ncbi:uncharacterized protein LOC115594830 isoform X4 [Sparus aurata]|uniref:uncharacterized protein LOC115594830 isoform X4 n=1 Tax=Sparus aurata TaxID=8175 RepID=UPI0011C15E4D|nr:uncharacterized protein LOC115594830 isoform X4 [Sparus aurata]
MTEVRRRRRKSPDQDALEHIVQGKDKVFLEGRFINKYKGRGVFTREYIEPKSFVVEYRGVVSQSEGADDKNNKYVFDFMWNGKRYCIDASKEDGTLGRLVNDDHVHPNCKVKRIMVNRMPHLCLFAVREIFPGEEITYNYGDSAWPWRSLEASGGTDDQMTRVRSNLEISKDDTEASGGTDDQMTRVRSNLEISKDDTEASGGTDDQMTRVRSNLEISKDDTEASGGTDDQMTRVRSNLEISKDDTEASGGTDDQMTRVRSNLEISKDDTEASGGTDDQMTRVRSNLEISKDDTEASGGTDDQMTRVRSNLEISKDDTEASGGTDDQMTRVRSNLEISKDDTEASGGTDDQMTRVRSNLEISKDDTEASGGTDDQMTRVRSNLEISKDDTEASGGTDDQMTRVRSNLEISKDDTEASGGTDDQMTRVRSNLEISKDDTEASGGTDDQMTRVRSNLEISKDDTCHHIFACAALNDLDNCADCSGSFSRFRWLGYTCKLCSRSWHKSCFLKINSSLDVAPEKHVSDSEISDDSSDDYYVPESCHGSSSDQDGEDVPIPVQPCTDDESTYTPTTSHTQTLSAETAESSSTEISAAREGSSCTQKNYCYVCKKPQSKIARHLKKHEKEEPDIAEAFLLPKNSKERKRLLEKLRNRGNYEHNQEVIRNQGGTLKVKRRQGPSKISVDAKMYVHCTYCKGLFVRKELWRHSRRCPSKTVSETEANVKSKVLALADIAESTCSQAISIGVWKILGKMRQDEIASVVRNDFLTLQLAQSLYNKHGSDPTKFEYMRTKVREMGRLLLTLRQKYSIFSFEDAVKPNNFYKIIGAVKTVAGYDEEKHSYSTPSLALKLGHSLKKIGDIILCRAISAEDEILIKAAERFTKLCTKEWAGQVSHTALATLSKSKFNKPSTIPFTEDVQLLHKYLEEKSAGAVENLKEHQSPQAYAELARVTLAQIILFNRRRAGEVSKMTLESFKKRDQTELHGDLAASLSPVEQKLARHFSRVEIMGKRGRKVAVLLNPEVLSAATLLAEKRDTCDVDKDNPFLFGRPHCSHTSYYRGQDCMRHFAQMCGAKNPENLRSTHLRKHMATLSQILNLKNNELDQLANFLGHDIRVHRDFYRLPEATIEVAKISKLLLAFEKGTLGEFQGKSLDEIEVEDELDLELDVGEQDDGDDGDDGDDEDDGDGGDGQAEGDDTIGDNESDGDDEGGRDDEGGGNSEEGGGDAKDGGSEESDCALGLRENQEMKMPEDPTSSSGKRKRMVSTQNKTKSYKGQKKLRVTESVVTSSKEIKSRRCVKRPWSKTEISAVMKHFKTHITNGDLATKVECEQCKIAEHPALKDRSLQNIRDFVRNRGLTVKKK